MSLALDAIVGPRDHPLHWLHHDHPLHLGSKCIALQWQRWGGLEGGFILTLTQLSWSLILQGEVGFSFAGSLSDRYPAADRAAEDCAAVETLYFTLRLRDGARHCTAQPKLPLNIQ